MPPLNLDFFLYPASLSSTQSTAILSSTFNISWRIKTFTLELNFSIAYEDNQSCCKHL